MKHHAKLPSRGASSSSSPPPAHRLSHAIAKAAPPPQKVRIIHVLAPEIIKTEARHFRELVQRLTGKPPQNQKGSCASSASTGADAPPSPSPPTSVSSCDTAGDEGLGAGAGAAMGIGMNVVKEEAESSSPAPLGGEGGGGGFLRAFELDRYDDNDGFYQGLQDFLFSPCDMDEAAGGFNFCSGAWERF